MQKPLYQHELLQHIYNKAGSCSDLNTDMIFWFENDVSNIFVTQSFFTLWFPQEYRQ